MKLLENNYIDYEDSVHIIELRGNYNKFKLQYSGILCQQFTNSGICRHKVKIKQKVFDPTWWYNLTWVSSNEVENEGVKYSKDQILKEILRLILLHTGENFSIEEVISFEEALILIKKKKKYFIITWENSD